MTRGIPSVGLLVGLVGFTLAGLVSLSMASLKPAQPLPQFDHLGGDFELESTGELNSLSGAQGKVVLLSFGFTSCHDICPMMLSKFQQVYKGLGEDGDDVVSFFVTLDPKRDTLDKMREHLGAFDERIIGLRGSDEQITELQKSLAVSSAAITGTDQFMHSDRIFVFDQQGRLRAMPSLDEPVDALLAAIGSLRD